MPRTARAAEGGVVYHVLNRGNDRRAIFRRDHDYAAFIKLLLEARERAAGRRKIGRNRKKVDVTFCSPDPSPAWQTNWMEERPAERINEYYGSRHL